MHRPARLVHRLARLVHRPATLMHQLTTLMHRLATLVHRLATLVHRQKGVGVARHNTLPPLHRDLIVRLLAKGVLVKEHLIET